MADVEGGYTVIRRHLGSPFYQILWLSWGFNMFEVVLLCGKPLLPKSNKNATKVYKDDSFISQLPTWSLLQSADSPCGLIRVLKV